LLLRTELISFFNGVETVMTVPALQAHANIEPATWEAFELNIRLLKLPVGIENIET
jgi:cystathionine beta-lyase/cystathionine gamma-synthase